MRNFFEDYLAIPLGILLFLLIAPTVMYGGVKLAYHIFDIAPACEVKK
jgi:hypothetical protein